MRIKQIIIAVICFTVLLISTAIAGAVKDISGAEVDDILANNTNIVVLDIRTPHEFTAGAIKGAVNIDYTANDFEEQLAEFVKNNPSQHWLVYCRSGNRSGKAMPILTKQLNGTIYHVKKGYNDYPAK